MLPKGIASSSYVSALKDLQRGSPQGRKWTLFMVAGGHFAGIVVRVSRPSDDTGIGASDPLPKGKQKKPVPEMEILRHKTFHRYTSKLSSMLCPILAINLIL